MRQIDEPGRAYIPAARRPANRSGLKLVDAGCKGHPLTQAEVEAINLTGCTVRAFVTRTCERGTVGCDMRHDYSPSLSQVFDKLRAAGVEVGVNCDPVPALRHAGAL